jgi:hypothetical protein
LEKGLPESTRNIQMAAEEKPCCSAEALRRIRQVDIDGHRIGLAMLDDTLEEVRHLDLPEEGRIGDELLRKVRIYNYIPPAVDEKYRRALIREYRKKVSSHGKD